MALSRINADSIADGTVIAADIADGSITSPKIAAATITGDKIGVGQITSNLFAAGAVSTSNISSGNSNVSVTSANGDVTIGTAGSERMRIDSSGNVGIGTSSPVYKLHVNTTFDHIHMTNPTTGTTGSDGFTLDALGTSARLIQRESAPMEFYTAATERMRINSSGNVGIGTSSPSAKLSIVSASSTGNSISDWSNHSIILGPNAGSSAGSVMALGYNTTSNESEITSLNPLVSWRSLALFSGGMRFCATNGAESMRIDSSGNVGIGTTTPDYKLVVDGEGSAGGFAIKRTGTLTGSGSLRLVGSSGSEALGINVNATERMRIDSIGNLLVGTTITGSLSSAVVSAGYFFGTSNVSAGTVLQVWNQATNGNNVFSEFVTEGGGGILRGSITYNRAGGLTAYNTTSDYRAKDIISPVLNSGEVIDSVPVYMGKMKEATQARPMFIAHETPDYAHTGEKDAVDKDGNPVYQQMDASSLVPVLWAEIQSLRKRVAQLESK